jgi:formylglycine-generating enzyme required for sulfatase activity
MGRSFQRLGFTLLLLALPMSPSSAAGVFNSDTVPPPVVAKPKPRPATPVETPPPPVPAGPATSATAPGTEFRDCPDCPEMVVVPAGRFLMGSPASEAGRHNDESPQHMVTIGQPFAISKFEVTFAEWDACVAAGGCNSYRPDDNGWGRGDRPVINVSWEDAQAYVAWLGKKSGKPYRLPSESEWEYVARAGTTTSRYWGESERVACSYANVADWSGKRQYSTWTEFAECDDGAIQTSPVGHYRPNSFGIYDPIGNVWEWTADCPHVSYAGAPSDGSPWPGGDCSKRVVRGGAWNYEPSHARAAERFRYFADLRTESIGFRLARTL